MSLTQDLDTILDTVLPSDPSFRRIERAVMDDCISDARRRASEGSTEAFLLAAMRLLALPGNGHTRLIPNDGIQVLPLRFVSLGTAVRLMATALETEAPRGELVAVNGTPVGEIEAAAETFLAGTPQRKRVIGPILLAWPHALARLGFSAGEKTTAYRLKDDNGRITDLTVENGRTVPASKLYPRSEHGRADPAWKPGSLAEITDWQGMGLSIELPSFFDPDGRALPEAIAGAAKHVRTGPSRNLVIDVRGNTGGDFLKTLPLVDAICVDQSRRVAVLIDKFTFSAAVVFVAILRHRLGDRLTVIGEEMGDGFTFFAEGGLLDLPVSGAVVRYSTAFHDWENGTSDETTPPEIARHMVPAGKLTLDREWDETSTAGNEEGAFYRRVLTSLDD
ncbi:peptidase S41 [Ciceribacter sp. L1K22]|uniref:peptidase S41 n=1 Tax=Ciceribacter sp. L1K22 TaxID=2820275 RepID=UPI001ABE8F5A|nr:peptidase S41 [Ciceribacter sp. L1K22]MBO3761095.1 peptidase S41 [Ciceribacter sp. L1K22]